MPQDRLCSDCLLKNSCVYSYVFESLPPDDAVMMRKYPSVPHPFIIEPPSDNKKHYNKGDSLDFNLILIGKAIDYLPYFIYAFEETGRVGLGSNRQGKFIVDSVINVNPFSSESSVIYTGTGNNLKSPVYIISPEHLKDMVDKMEQREEVTFNFLTPARIKYRDRYIDYLEFHIFMRTFLRRLSAIYYFHCGGEELLLDYKGIIDSSRMIDMIKSFLYWEDWERYSSRQNDTMKFGGFKGKVTFQGNLKEFIIFILLGKYLHAGKNASFGLGKYELIF